MVLFRKKDYEPKPLLFGQFQVTSRRILNSSDFDFPLKLRKKLECEIKEFGYKILTLISINIDEDKINNIDLDLLEKELKDEKEIRNKQSFENPNNEDDLKKEKTPSNKWIVERPHYYRQISEENDYNAKELDEELEDKFDQYSFVIIARDKKFRKLLEKVNYEVEQAKEILLL